MAINEVRNIVKAVNEGSFTFERGKRLINGHSRYRLRYDHERNQAYVV